MASTYVTMVTTVPPPPPPHTHLQELTGEAEELEESPPKPEPPKKASPPGNGSGVSKRSPHPPPTSSSKNLDVIMERLRMYETAAAAAKEKGEGTKVRRYQRAIDIINTMARKVSSTGLGPCEYLLCSLWDTSTSPTYHSNFAMINCPTFQTFILYDEAPFPIVIRPFFIGVV